MRSLHLSYLLCLLGFVGFAGIHRIYLGKPITGLIWFFTGGLAGIGTIYDLITMPSQVDEANRKALPPGQAALPPGSYGQGWGGGYNQPQAGWNQPQAPAGANLRDQTVDVELRVLQLARQHNGRLTTPIVAAELAIPIAEADKKLGELASAGHANIDVTDEGVVVYDFPALRVTG